MALWIVRTHCFQAWDKNPYLLVTSPTKRCGKTTLFSLLKHLTCNSMMVSGATPSFVQRVLNKSKPTLLMDEFDSFKQMSDKFGNILNAAHNREGAFIGISISQGSDWNPELLDVYAPIALALINTKPVQPTLQDRCIEIKLQRKAANETVKRYVVKEATALLKPIRLRATRWAVNNMKDLEAYIPDIPKALDDRQGDNWFPLLAIADLAGGALPDQARAAALLIAGTVVEEDRDLDLKLLKDAYKIVKAKGGRVHMGELFSSLRNLGKDKDEDSPWTGWWIKDAFKHRQHIRTVLKGYGIEISRNCKVGIDNKSGYKIEAFGDAYERYIKTNGVEFSESILPDSTGILPQNNSETLMNKGL